ncbi:vesicle-associated membrane protein 1 isoform X3 [Lingula anatina]|uniref:Vesicle-associated membrane protein 1 isoform X3 n=1 Tax=Lingula anatina TaxID=7574 RepID=A0A1S3I996_LINAN|nr:vesicle-associated membrane protein 1 isoform X3 [Lingula anatina]|eukprot:XP_013393959.1 vesicle-associated membrane protein 1 isoform X3 [Lingula anatina]
MSAAGGPGGPPGPAQPSKKLQQTQAQVDEVVDIMRVNVEKVLERDQKLSELDGRADALQAGASQFEASAGKLKNKYWWKNCKSMIMMGVVIAVVVIIVGVYVYTKYIKTDDAGAAAGPSVAPVGPATAPGPTSPAAIVSPSAGPVKDAGGGQ